MESESKENQFNYSAIWKTAIALSLVSMLIGLISWPLLSKSIWNTLYHNASIANKEQALRIGTLLSDDLLKGTPPEVVLNSFQEMLQKSPHSKLRFACIVKGDDTVIAHPNPKEIGKDVAAYSVTGEYGKASYGQSARENKYFTGKLERPDHSIDLISQTPIETVPWSITIHTSFELLNQRLKTIQQSILWIAISSTLILIFVSTFAVRLVSSHFERKLKIKNEVLTETLQTLKETQNELIESEKMASLGQLVSGVAHQINTPVGICVTASSVNKDVCEEIRTKLNSDQLTKKTLSEYVNRLFSCNQLMQHNLSTTADIIQRFKDISVEKTGIHKEKVDIGKKISEVICTMKSKIEQMGSSLSFQTEKKLYVDIDMGHLEQVINELVFNAICHAYPHEEKGKVFITLTQEHSDALLKISDNGIGMSLEVCKNIFSPFYTESGLNSTSGLGLHVVYNIVHESMNGTIEVESTENKGTTFSVYIPLHKP